MKRKILGSLLLGTCLLFIGGCGSGADADTDTIYITKKGVIDALNVAAFEQDYYDEAELSAYIEDTIQNYVSGAGDGTVKLETLKVEDQVAKVQIRYAGYEDYADFNGVEFYCGSVLDAKVNGYTIPKALKAVSEKVTEPFDDEDQVVVIGQTTDIKVNGTILYVSDNVTVKEKDLAAVTYDSQVEDPAMAYIVYKK